MQLPLNVSVFLILGLINPFGVSRFAVPEELEGSGNNLGGSGSGDGSELASSNEIKDNFEPNIYGDSSGLTFDNTFWPAEVDTSESVVLSNSKSILNHPHILAGLIVGGVGGAIIGATLSAILIYRHKERWRKKPEEGFR